LKITLPTAAKVGLWMAVSAICFAALVGTVRHLSADMNVLVIGFWRNCIAFALFLPWLWRTGPARLKTQHLKQHSIRALFLVTSSSAMFFSVMLMPLAEVTELSFTSPLFTMLLAVLILKESIGPRRWISLIIGFSGVLLMLRPGSAAFDPVAFVVLLSSLTFAVVVIIAKQLAANESPELITFYLVLFTVPISFLPALLFWQWPQPDQLGWLLFMGIMANGNMYSISRALQLGDASLSQPFDFIRLPCTALVGYLFFAQVPDFWTWMGAAVIFASAIYITQREARVKRAD
jgi:drug/metabolite transporter (DMT)-like permease